MDRTQNPIFTWGWCTPPELVGRDPILEDARVLMRRIKRKRPEKSMLLTGLRGLRG